MILADSNSVLYEDRVLAQHQVVLGLMRQYTQDPSINSLNWLDLACGKGQILNNIEQVIPAERRNKINYIGFDVSKEFAQRTEKRAKELFVNPRVEICDLVFFEKYLNDSDKFDIITFTNTAHEITPKSLSETFVSATCRIDVNGFLYVYDMEQLPHPELGAITWNGKDIHRIFSNMLTSIGVKKESLPDVAIWPHKSCTCWNLQLHRKHIKIDSLNDKRIKMLEATEKSIEETLKNKFLNIHTQLDTISQYGSQTISEQEETIKLLFEYWAISKALGIPISKSMSI